MTVRNEINDAKQAIRKNVDLVERMYSNRNQFIFREGDTDDMIAFVTLRTSYCDLDENGEIDYEYPINRFMHFAFNRYGMIWISMEDDFIAPIESFKLVGSRHYVFSDVLSGMAVKRLTGERDELYNFFDWRTIAETNLRKTDGMDYTNRLAEFW